MSDQNKLEKPVFNTTVWGREDALRRMGGKEKRLLMMANIFLEESVGYLDSVNKAFDQQSTEELASSSHALKGAAGNLGALAVYEMAEFIEHSARAGDLEKISAIMGDFNAQFLQLKQHLESELQSADRKGDENITALSSVENGKIIQRAIVDAIREVKRGGLLAPTDIDRLRELSSHSAVALEIEKLVVSVNDFETESAIQALKKIADIEGVDL